MQVESPTHGLCIATEAAGAPMRLSLEHGAPNITGGHGHQEMDL